MAETGNPKYKLVGQPYQLPDLVAKVTGRSKYAEDFRSEGMLFCKLLLSPHPHAKILSIDTSEAMAMPGVMAVLTGEEMPLPPAGFQLGESREYATSAAVKPEVAIASEPLYQGEPVLAVAAVDELTAAEAIEKIKIKYQPLPFAIDPLETLKPNSPNPRLEGNVWLGARVGTLKFTEAQAAELEAGRLPFLDDAPQKWQIGDVDAAMKKADYILDETVIHQSSSHAPLESRSAMAYWRNGKLYLHGSTQSTVQTVASISTWVGIPEDQIVLISEYTGGGFGGKIPGAQSMAIPALLAKKTGRPVMMRISREEENYIGRARTGVHMRAKIGFRKDGRVLAIDVCTIGDCGPYGSQGDFGNVANIATALYMPETIRFRGIGVITNTPPRVSQRAPGGEQSAALFEPLIAKAARHLGVDQVEMRKVNAAVTGGEFGPPPTPPVAGGRGGRGAAAAAGAPAGPPPGRNRFTGAFLKEALDKGAEMFNWTERIKRNGQRVGSKVTGVGVGIGTFGAGALGYDGLMTLREDGRLYIHQGIGNLGTGSVMDTARFAAEVVEMPWEKCEVIWGDTSKNLPWTCRQGGSSTTHAHTRANYAGGMDLRQKLQEIAAKDLGGKPEDYVLGNERVTRKGGGASMTYAQAAKRAIALGGKYDGHELPENINKWTRTSASKMTGLGVMGVGNDNYGRKGITQGFACGFAEIEVDTETGEFKVIEYVGVADVGTVINPRGLHAQIMGGAIQGLGQMKSQRWTYDGRYGVSLSNRFHYNKPPTILDIPQKISAEAVHIPDPQSPAGAKGIGEPSICAGVATIICTLTAALGDDYLRRTPATPSLILASIEAGKRSDNLGLRVNV
jgi:xanthine dehydrogenase molybdenum-binding subunit